MPVVMKMTLLLLLFGSVWAEDLNMTTSTQPTSPVVSTTTEAAYPNSMASHHAVRSTPGGSNQATRQGPTPRHTASEVSSPEISTPNSDDTPVPASIVSQEPHTMNSLMTQEISTKTSNPTVPAMSASGHLNVTGGTNATGSLEVSNGTSESTVTMTTGSLEASRGTIGPSVIMTSSSLETSDGTSEPPITMVTGTVEISEGTSGLPVTVTTSSPKTPKGTSGSLISMVKISTPEPPSSYQGTKNTLLMAVLVAMLVVIVLLALLLLWRQRQKRRTGALTLSRGAKRNGVVDAWVGPTPVPDEEAVITTVGVSGGDKGSGVPDGEGSGRRPTLTTFFGRRKSRQGSLALEELKAGSASSTKGEEEPLVGSEDEVLESPISDGPDAGDGEVV